MTVTEILLRLAAGVVLTLANAFFVVTEFALTRIRQLDESQFRDHPGLRRAWRMTEELEIYLTGCQLGITTSSILLGVVAEPAVTELIRPLLEPLGMGEKSLRLTSVVAAVVVINLVHKIWGEQAPTYLGVERPRLVVRYCALPLFYWTRVMYPVIKAGDGLAKLTLRLFGVEIRRSWTEAEEGEGAEEGEKVGEGSLRSQVIEVLGRGGLPEDRQREVVRTLEIGELPVRRIMVPAGEIVALSTEKPFADNYRVLSEHVHTRLPLVGDGLKEFVGIVYVPALLPRLEELRAGEVELADLAVPPMTLPADCEVSRVIDEFQRQRQELALVEEGGEIVGLVTSTDAFEAIAGELRDPFD